MNNLVDSFKPEFVIDQLDSARVIRIGLALAPVEGVRSKVRYVNATLRDSEPIEVEVTLGESESEFLINLIFSGGASDSKTIRIGELKFSQPTHDASSLADDLTAVAQHAFFAALRGDATPRYDSGQAHWPGQPTPRPQPASPTAEALVVSGAAPIPRARRFAFKKGLVAAAMLLGVGLVVYGGLHSFSKPRDPLQTALNGDNYADLQQQIREQFAKDASNKGGGAYGALQGQNIAIDTMRAMGLDPGKANTGCLVGVK